CARERQRQHWRDERGSQVAGAWGCDFASRRRQRSGCGSSGAGAVRRTASAAHHDHGSVLRRARPSVPCLAQISRRQGRCHQPWRFYPAHPEIHFVDGGPVLAHRSRLPLRLARLRRCGGGFSAAGLGLPRIRGLAATGFDRPGFGARYLEAPPKHRPSRQWNGIEVRNKVRNKVRNVRSNPQMSRIAVIGAGAWGTGLAIVLGRKGTDQIRLWAREAEVRESVSSRRINELFLPGHEIPDAVSVTGDLREAIRDAEILVSV